jgi:hypothetical protein
MRMLESLQGAPYLLRAGDAGADAHSGEAALDAAIGDGLRDAEREADGRVGEGHDGGDDGQPPNLVKVGNLREEDLRGAEQIMYGLLELLHGSAWPWRWKHPALPTARMLMEEAMVYPILDNDVVSFLIV